MKPWHNTALELAAAGKSWRQIAVELGMAKSTVSDFLRTQKINENKPMPKVLILDIETAPAIGYYWSRWKTTVGQNQVLQEGYLLTFSAKWLGSDDILECKLPDFDLYNTEPKNDRELLKVLAGLLDEADFVVAHNGRKFDLPTINAHLVKHDILPPSPYKIIDTCDIAKKVFKFPSNSLKSLAIFLKCQHDKLDTGGFELWARVMDGDPEAWDHMMEYNVFDVIVLEEVYLKLRAWYNTHPSLSALIPQKVTPHCPVCCSDDLRPTGKLYYTAVSAFEVLRCHSCGKHSRTRQNVLDREHLVVGI
ncbi:hypothetical protein VL2_gp097 [Pseudomonas phage vB_PaeM_VL12]|uniref:YprB ribonuclease H-like domain-containing protein n=8 Tax=Nankokuvirus TaxID=1925779 RepID=A0A0K0L9J3_9CAUD|nr:ribonuclease H-like domain-containing protein [Pseudomonas aeruginosa]YP_004306808.1 DNA polymerase exonuclease subunit [Pseudomonas phage KPP10]YP_008856939.1 DNA polymerase exonuclease subunit [Pseudomonas phage PAK_P5]YP_009206074.1 DNA polymerase exonuclease subunit [Pseudomonas phage vB_PaeM_PS24]YP_009604740.1 DNA polymerase exonuclease subunit [Pseudomonas phage vB_PaeM_G1]QIQ63825.1 hypothetical protein Epa24_00108 [Pseudomonas phage Epa24]QIQ64079.1 hypothetical protein Epa17_0004